MSETSEGQKRQGRDTQRRGTSIRQTETDRNRHAFRTLFLNWPLCMGSCREHIMDKRDGDIEIDKISHPLRSLPSGKISTRQAWILVTICSLISVISAISGSIILNNLGLNWIPLAIIWFLAFTLMITYEVGPTTKKYGYLGNIIIGGMLGLVIIYGAASVGDYDYLVTLCIALMATFMGISREIVKDVHDFEGDSKWGRKTLPILFGEQNSRNLAYVIVMLGIISIMLPFMMGWGGLDYWMIVFQVPTIVVLLGLNGPLRTGEDKAAINSLLMSMVLGLIGFFLLTIAYPYLI